ncbi:Na+/H+ antiporter NhaA [Pseudomonas sp. A-1]|uniref:Na+/H+ antiporter NhaA n=1 Tax=Pseudomonas sp. A-1 TaxID=1821274 RepID=UPI0015A81B45|nr:Na+/H+ antiporter NhaA [Pseudomonas sp. A-1]
MTPTPSRKALPAAQRIADKAFNALEHFLHIEAVSGIVLLLAAAIALAWANSPAADSYAHLWHLPLGFSLGDFSVSHSLHFWINDALMTVFFLVVGMEIRREIHDGALADLRQAALPLGAALGGVVAPALIYLAIAGGEGLRQGWAVPTATDIAFAVGVLALLGKSIPGCVRIFLLALAIIDDVIAVLIIALFYSGGLDPNGFLIAGAGLLLVLGFQAIGIGSAWAYVLPGALLWFGLLHTGAHPTLAGVVLGLLTPVLPTRGEAPLDSASRALEEFAERARNGESDAQQLMQPVRRLRYAQRELLPPVVRVQLALHPWVAYGIMPLFALANAGVNLDGIDLNGGGATAVMLGVALALVVGKPLGILLSSWLLVRLGWCRLPAGMNWSWLGLIGVLAGIGFTMSIFIATLAFADASLLGAAKLGVLIASALAACLGLTLGGLLVRRARAARAGASRGGDSSAQALSS